MVEMESSMCLSSAILSLCLSCMWLGVLPYISSAPTDTIKPGEELQFSEKLLVSAKGTFTLGFFSLESGSYLGIWFTIDAQKEKVWVANRDKPISGTDANLTLDADGKLMIMHSGGDPIVLNSNQAARNSTATLLDSGNFVLEEFNSDRSVKEKLWESFDNPTDTLLPGMKLGINLKTGQNWSLASWINEQVPAPGTFTLEWNGTQLVMKRRGGTYWSSGTLKNRSFEFIPWLSFDTCNNIYSFNSVANENEIYFSYSVPDGVVSEWALNSRGGLSDTKAITGCRFWSTKFTQTYAGDANREALYVLSSSRVTGNSWWIWVIIAGVAKQVHPDKNPSDPLAVERSQTYNEEWQRLRRWAATQLHTASFGLASLFFFSLSFHI
ncbi:hypothetical protein VitviT2T_010209 [Vitis vinifera]|uniref:Bulb-type lectin domain-containing protein n=1 Tax=Vitis vinifera TaxID=29760 RepID=A0ABY9C9J3_VITVI|nr:hypothetical protein VitviT2T_010209 [Vitis vinifera]